MRKSWTGIWFRQSRSARSTTSCARAFAAARVSVSDEVKELGHVVVANALLMMVEATEFDDEEHMNGHFHFCNRIFRWSISYGDSRNPANAKITERELHLWL